MSEGDRPVWVKAGKYRAVLVDWKKGHPQFGRQVLLMRFRIIEEGDFHEVVLPVYYRVKWGKGNNFGAGWHSYFCRDYQQCFGRVERKDRYAMSKFESVVLKVKVVVNTTDAKGQPLAPVNQYSRVERVLEVVT